MATENIPSRLHSVAEGNVVTGANEILDDDKNKKQSVINQENDQRLETLETAVGTGGSVDSRIESAKTEIVGGASSDCNTLGKAEALISTNANDIAALQDAYAALTQNDVVVVAPSDTWPVATPEQNTIYRVVDREHTPPQYYADYMWNGTAMVPMAQYNNAIDPRPKKASQNLVTSGGVFDNMGALDVSELNATENPHTLAKYVDLSAALAAIPTDYQKGGMSIKFVQSSDNKYAKFFCTADEFTTDVTQWQGVDAEPTAGSDNLVKSGGVVSSIGNLSGFVLIDGIGNIVGNIWYISGTDYTHKVIKLVEKGEIKITATNLNTKYCFLKSYNGGTGTPDYATGFSDVVTVNANKTLVIPSDSIPSDANYLYVVHQEGNNNRIPKEVDINNSSILDFNVIKGLKDLENRDDEKLGAVNDKVRLADHYEINKVFALTASVWSDGTAEMFYIEGRTSVYIKATTMYCTYAFLKSNDINSNPQFAGEATQSSFVNGNNEATMTIPPDAKYLVVSKNVQGTDRSPAKVEVDGINAFLDLNQLVLEINNTVKGIQTVEYGKEELVYGKNMNLGSTNPTIGTDVISDNIFIDTNYSSLLQAKVKQGDTLRIFTKSIAGSNRAVVLVDSNGIYRYVSPKQDGSQDYNYLVNPLVLNAEYDGTLYVCCYNADVNNFKVIAEGNYGITDCFERIYEVSKRVDELEDIVATPEILLPDNIYAVVDKQFNLFYDYIVCGIDNGLSSPTIYMVEVECNVGKSWQRFFQYTPIASEVGTHSFVVKVYNADREIIATKTVTLNVVAASAPSGTKNIVQIGDSTCPQAVTETLYNNFDGLGFTPIFRGTMNESPYNSQGMGGRSFETFATYGSYSYHRFNVSAISVTPTVGEVYTTNGSNYQVVEINLSDGTGYINTHKVSGTNEPTATGTLTNGSKSFDYTSFEVTASNPLWNGGVSGSLDIANYRTAVCGMSENEYFDLVAIRLGCNDCINASRLKNADTIVSYAKTIIDAFLADHAQTKILIEIPTLDGNTSGGWASNYGATISKGKWQWNMRLLIQTLIREFDGGAYNENVSVVSTGAQIDRYYGYGLTTRQVSDRIEETETVHNNAVHPILRGYQQIADAEMASYLPFF